MPGKVFVHKGKYDTYYYKFDTKEEQQGAWLSHFEDNDLAGYYADAIGDEARYVELARQGDWKAAMRLADARAEAEYEGFSIAPLYGLEDRQGE